MERSSYARNDILWEYRRPPRPDDLQKTSEKEPLGQENVTNDTPKPTNERVAVFRFSDKDWEDHYPDRS